MRASRARRHLHLPRSSTKPSPRRTQGRYGAGHRAIQRATRSPLRPRQPSTSILCTPFLRRAPPASQQGTHAHCIATTGVLQTPQGTSHHGAAASPTHVSFRTHSTSQRPSAASSARVRRGSVPNSSTHTAPSAARQGASPGAVEPASCVCSPRPKRSARPPQPPTMCLSRRRGEQAAMHGITHLHHKHARKPTRPCASDDRSLLGDQHHHQGQHPRRTGKAPGPRRVRRSQSKRGMAWQGHARTPGVVTAWRSKEGRKGRWSSHRTGTKEEVREERVAQANRRRSTRAHEW